MKLKVISNYRNQHTQYVKDSVIEVDQAAGEFLLRDAPGCFKKVKDKPEPIPVEPEVVDEPESKEIESPVVDKMIHRGSNK